MSEIRKRFLELAACAEFIAQRYWQGSTEPCYFQLQRVDLDQLVAGSSQEEQDEWTAKAKEWPPQPHLHQQRDSIDPAMAACGGIPMVTPDGDLFDAGQQAIDHLRRNNLFAAFVDHTKCIVFRLVPAEVAAGEETKPRPDQVWLEVLDQKTYVAKLFSASQAGHSDDGGSLATFRATCDGEYRTTACDPSRRGYDGFVRDCGLVVDSVLTALETAGGIAPPDRGAVDVPTTSIQPISRDWVLSFTDPPEGVEITIIAEEEDGPDGPAGDKASAVNEAPSSHKTSVDLGSGAIVAATSCTRTRLGVAADLSRSTSREVKGTIVRGSPSGFRAYTFSLRPAAESDRLLPCNPSLHLTLEESSLDPDRVPAAKSTSTST